MTYIVISIIDDKNPEEDIQSNASIKFLRELGGSPSFEKNDNLRLASFTTILESLNMFSEMHQLEANFLHLINNCEGDILTEGEFFSEIRFPGYNYYEH
jgi:hypothetical protein